MRQFQGSQYQSRTRSPDVKNSTVVRVGSLGIGDGGGTNRNDGGGAGRGVTDNIVHKVTSSDNSSHTRGDEVGGSSVDGREVKTTQAHGSNRRTTAAASSLSDPVHCGNTVEMLNISSMHVSLPCERGTHTSAQSPDL